MLLFTFMILFCLLFLFIADFVKLLKISQLMRKKSATYFTKMQQELEIALENLKQAKNSHYEEMYAYSVKVLRAEEIVNKIRGNIQKEENVVNLKSASIETILTYGGKAIISLILLITSIRNRHTPVMTFDEKLNFQPLTGLMSFPTGVSNAISVPMWILSCNVTFGFLNKLLRGKNEIRKKNV